MSGEDYLTVAEAAERIKTSDEMVRRMLRDGRLRGKRLGGRRMGWRVAASEVERLLQPDDQPRLGRIPRRLALPVRVQTPEVQHALAEADWARRDGDLAEARRWEQRARELAASAEATP